MPDTLTSYDEVPYTAHAYPQSCPERLATLATLFGMSPPDIRRCRVLELGCGLGGNLLPMAERLPESEFVGVDLSAKQIADAQSVANRIGLKNIRLLHQSITDVGPDLGTFDYIVCHGVFSWVPDEVRQKILAICDGHLSGHGVAFISYNAYPGWHVRSIVRDVMAYRARRFEKPTDQAAQGRAIVDFLTKAIPAKESAYSQLLKDELGILQQLDDSYIVHEHLNKDNRPFYFHEFVEEARRHRLQYLGEANFHSMSLQFLAPDIAATLTSIATDLVDLEQYVDFVKNRSFRMNLLCHSDVALNRTITPERLMKLTAAANVVADAPTPGSSSATATFQVGGFKFSSAHPVVKTILGRLGTEWPRSVPIAELMAIAPADATAICKFITDSYGKGALSLSVGEWPFVTSISERPAASPLARFQADSSDQVTNRRHELVRLDDTQRAVIRLLDGARVLNAICDELVVQANRGKLQVRDPLGRIIDDQELRRIFAGRVNLRWPN